MGQMDSILCDCNNTTPHMETIYSPYEFIYGKLPGLPTYINLENNTGIYNLYLFKIRLNKSLNNARKNIELIIIIISARTPEIGQAL